MKSGEVVYSPEQMPRLLNMAIQTALAKRGVAVLVISGDMAFKNSNNNALLEFPTPSPVIVPSSEELQKMAHLLNQAKSITLLCGSGCEEAYEELMLLCDVLKAPMVHTLRGKSFIVEDNPYDVGMTGLIGFSSGYYAMEACDTLLLLGTSFPYRQFYPEDAQIIQVDKYGEQLGKRCDIKLGLVGDIKATIQALLPLLHKHSDASHLEKSHKHYKKSRKELDELAHGKSGEKPIHPQYLTRIINKISKQDALFTCDVGTPTVWAARYLKMNGQRRLLGSFNHGSMANALSQAIGMQCAYPKRQVVALCGDGGFSMLMGDVITLIQQKLPIKVVIFNNGSLGFVEMEMMGSGMLNFGTDLINPNFAEMAKAIGLFGVRIEDPADIEVGLQQAFAYEGPALVDVVVNRQELLMPPIITSAMVRGFGLFMLKAIIDGQGDRIVELVKTNLWR